MNLDPERRELRSGSALVPIEPKVFDLLELLIRNRDHVVSRDDLLASTWGGRIVSDSAIAVRVNAARRAIGDDGEQQRWIRTVARKGFRFVCPVCEATKPAVSDSTVADQRRTGEHIPSDPKVIFSRTNDDVPLAVAAHGEGAPLVLTPTWAPLLEDAWQSPARARGLRH